MKPILATSLAALTMGFVIVLCGAAEPAPSAALGAPRYDAQGRLALPADYREWVFLSSGIDMSYSERRAVSEGHVFDNVFAPAAAYAAFKATGVWPENTVLMLENRSGAIKGSINKHGQFQTGEATGLEAHVKDKARFKGGWGFFGFEGDKPAQRIAYTADCYACHRDHAAADTTFVQFYPTLLPIATRLKTLNPAYVAETSTAANTAPHGR